MKLLDSDKHFMAEYYIRKGFRVVWLENGVRNEESFYK